MTSSSVKVQCCAALLLADWHRHHQNAIIVGYIGHLAVDAHRQLDFAMVVANAPLADQQVFHSLQCAAQPAVQHQAPLAGDLNPNVSLLRALWANKATLTPEVHKAYTAVHPHVQDRMGMYQLARELLGSSDSYDGLWERRARLANIPALLLWGLKDATFGPALGRWREVFPQAQVITFPEAGHFVMEEEPSVGERVERFIDERVVVYGV
jgi:pimeloyl-ACP methyl ester carboxylesterase